MSMSIETFVATGSNQPDERRHLAMLTIIRAGGRADVCMPFFAATAPVALGAAEKWWASETSKVDGRVGPRTTPASKAIKGGKANGKA